MKAFKDCLFKSEMTDRKLLGYFKDAIGKGRDLYLIVVVVLRGAACAREEKRDFSRVLRDCYGMAEQQQQKPAFKSEVVGMSKLNGEWAAVAG